MHSCGVREKRVVTLLGTVRYRYSLFQGSDCKRIHCPGDEAQTKLPKDLTQAIDAGKETACHEDTGRACNTVDADPTASSSLRCIRSRMHEYYQSADETVRHGMAGSRCKRQQNPAMHGGFAVNRRLLGTENGIAPTFPMQAPIHR